MSESWIRPKRNDEIEWLVVDPCGVDTEVCDWLSLDYNQKLQKLGTYSQALNCRVTRGAYLSRHHSQLSHPVLFTSPPSTTAVSNYHLRQHVSIRS